MLKEGNCREILYNLGGVGGGGVQLQNMFYELRNKIRISYVWNPTNHMRSLLDKVVFLKDTPQSPSHAQPHPTPPTPHTTPWSWGARAVQGGGVNCDVAWLITFMKRSGAAVLGRPPGSLCGHFQFQLLHFLCCPGARLSQHLLDAVHLHCGYYKLVGNFFYCNIKTDTNSWYNCKNVIGWYFFHACFLSFF
jgi:hypothetical protein